MANIYPMKPSDDGNPKGKDDKDPKDLENVEAPGTEEVAPTLLPALREKSISSAVGSAALTLAALSVLGGNPDRSKAEKVDHPASVSSGSGVSTPSGSLPGGPDSMAGGPDTDLDSDLSFLLTEVDDALISEAASLTPQEIQMLGAGPILSGGLGEIFEKGIFDVDWQHFDRWELLQLFTTAALPEWISALTFGLGLETGICAWILFLLVRRKGVPWKYKMLALPPVGVEWGIRKVLGKAEGFGGKEDGGSADGKSEKPKKQMPALDSILNESNLAAGSLTPAARNKLSETYDGAVSFMSHAPHQSHGDAVILLKNLVIWRYHDLLVRDKISALNTIQAKVAANAAEIERIERTVHRGPRDTEKRDALVKENQDTGAQVATLEREISGLIGTTSSYFTHLANDPMRFKTIARSAYKSGAAVDSVMRVVEPVMRERGFTPALIADGRVGAREMVDLIRAHSPKSTYRELAIVRTNLSSARQRYEDALEVVRDPEPPISVDPDAHAAHRNSQTIVDAYATLHRREQDLKSRMGRMERDKEAFDGRYPIGSKRRVAALTSLVMSVSGALGGGAYRGYEALADSGWTWGSEDPKTEVTTDPSETKTAGERKLEEDQRRELDTLRAEGQAVFDGVGRTSNPEPKTEEPKTESPDKAANPTDATDTIKGVMDEVLDAETLRIIREEGLGTGVTE